MTNRFLLLLIAFVLMLLAFTTAVGEGSIAGADWPVWATAAAVVWLLDQLVGERP